MYMVCSVLSLKFARLHADQSESLLVCRLENTNSIHDSGAPARIWRAIIIFEGMPVIFYGHG